MSQDSKRPPVAEPRAGSDVASSNRAEIDSFLARVKSLQANAATAGRLIFALDATMSRQPTWDMACQLQAEMFLEAGKVGRESGGAALSMRLIYFRGLNECRASPWISDAGKLAGLMSRITCQGGHTQIRKVLTDARREATVSGVRALVYVGDAMEENVDELCGTAGELGLLKTPCFMFQEGSDPAAEKAFQEIARLSGGAWCRFDPGASAQLRELLRAAAAYAAGGRSALVRLARNSQGATMLLGQMR
jgi:hypothetical protein